MTGARLSAVCRPRGGALPNAQTAFLRRPLLGGALSLVAAVAAVTANAQNDAFAVERMLRKSLTSKMGVNLRGIQTDATPGPDNGMETVNRRIVCRKDGRSLAICVDSFGKTGAVSQDDGQWTRNFDPATRTCRITRTPSRIVDEKSIERGIRRILTNYNVQ